MRASFDRVDVVSKRKDLFAETVVVLKRHFDANAILAALHVNDFLVQGAFVPIKVSDESI